MLYLVVGVLDGAYIDPTKKVQTRVLKLPLNVQLYSIDKVCHRLFSLEPRGVNVVCVRSVVFFRDSS